MLLSESVESARLQELSRSHGKTMNTKDAIKQTYEFSHMVLSGYLDDFSDDELMNRPGDGCNHIAWQLGHLISSECDMLNMVAFRCRG